MKKTAHIQKMAQLEKTQQEYTQKMCKKCGKMNQKQRCLQVYRMIPAEIRSKPKNVQNLIKTAPFLHGV